MPQALQRSYDGIIIGAGQHGLMLGSYLAKAGLKILLVERRLTYGGGLSHPRGRPSPASITTCTRSIISTSAIRPGSRISGSTDGSPTSRRATSSARRISTAPRSCSGRDLEETVANIARFSQKDAATFREWNRQAPRRSRAQILLPERYSEPLPQAEREALLSRTALGREFLDVTQRQPLDVVEELFENEHVKLLFLFKVSLFGTWLVDTLSKTSPMGSVIRAFDLESGYQLCQGGSFNLARGLMETFIAAGGSLPAAGRASSAS